jgi:general secretion pathway protein G
MTYRCPAPLRHPGEGRDLSETRRDLSRDPGLRRGDEEGRGDEGFTLVELMVVLVIIGLLAMIVIVNVMPAAEHAKTTTAQASVRTLEQAIDMYYLDNRRYPTSQEGLQALLDGRYLRRLEHDPWGNPFHYKSPGDNGQPYRVASWGADGREGGTGDDADIAN